MMDVLNLIVDWLTLVVGVLTVAFGILCMTNGMVESYAATLMVLAGCFVLTVWNNR